MFSCLHVVAIIFELVVEVVVLVLLPYFLLMSIVVIVGAYGGSCRCFVRLTGWFSEQVKPPSVGFCSQFALQICTNCESSCGYCCVCDCACSCCMLWLICATGGSCCLCFCCRCYYCLCLLLSLFLPCWCWLSSSLFSLKFLTYSHP